MTVCQDDPATAAALELREAATTQRKFWRQLRPEDVDLFNFDDLIQGAEGTAEASENRYKDVKSKAWAHWCQGSLAAGGA